LIIATSRTGSQNEEKNDTLTVDVKPTCSSNEENTSHRFAFLTPTLTHTCPSGYLLICLLLHQDFSDVEKEHKLWNQADNVQISNLLV
jgi:hypothetical protein